ncbi:MAG: Re/Si-specific NAD(P)(+) transhydrogenase subunit alpha [Thermoanaerobaculia bacterium]|nr:Re/Si-specific NAD(P)(+) transhydrogenase subunit alpha [Thermoanaerobaculia bacterium]
MVNVFVPKEIAPGETRVAVTPETVKKMVAAGLAVAIEQGAGAGAHFTDATYEDVGAGISTDRSASFADADLILSVLSPPASDLAQMKQSSMVVALMAPHQNHDEIKALKEGRVSCLAMELVPRISRAQAMDALSSQASIAGYKAVLLAAQRLGKYFPLLMTAAGTIPPARVVVMGAGVAGLQAVATAKRLGAVVEVSDIRDVVKEQVESLGGKFIELPDMGGGEGEGGYAREMGEEFLRRQREIVTRHVSQADVVICTALIPGKKAPTLVTEEMVKGMKEGSIVVDLAVAQGGNCELSKDGEEVTEHGVLILGPSNLPAETSVDASQLYARNIWALLDSILDKDAEQPAPKLDFEDEVIDGALLTHDGEIRHAPTREAIEGGTA